MNKEQIGIVGGSGYVGLRLCKALLDTGHHVLVITRSISHRLKALESCGRLEIIQWDLLQPAEGTTLQGKKISQVYYLIHSMTGNYQHFSEQELQCVNNLIPFLKERQADHVIYLSALCNSTKKDTSRHFYSRCATGQTLKNALNNIKVTTLKASIIIGSGSASFEIVRDLTAKLPLMVTPKWIKQKCQPVAISDVLQVLIALVNRVDLHNQDYDLCGTEILSFRELILLAAKQQHRYPIILSVPLLTPYLSSLWLYFVTSVDFALSRALVESMCYPSVSTGKNILHLLKMTPVSMDRAIRRAFSKENGDQVLSAWSDSLPLCLTESNLSLAMQSQKDQLLIYTCSTPVSYQSAPQCIKRVWEIGGKNGWYAYDTLWKIRGWIDSLLGGIGLTRGRRSQQEIFAGDCLDFWRVIKAEKQVPTEVRSSKHHMHLLLYAQMLLPGKAWLEFKLDSEAKTENKTFLKLSITAYFLPAQKPILGALGKAYWIATYPLHVMLFRRLLQKITTQPQN